MYCSNCGYELILVSQGTENYMSCLKHVQIEASIIIAIPNYILIQFFPNLFRST